MSATTDRWIEADLQNPLVRAAYRWPPADPPPPPSPETAAEAPGTVSTKEPSPG